MSAALVCCALPAQAVGTAAGTAIPNAATLTFVVDGKPGVTNAVAPLVTVAEVINVVLTSQNAGPLSVASPDTSRALTFALTNTGNGTETFRLVRNNALDGDQFDPLNSPDGAIYLESGAQPGFQASGPNADILYVPGVNDPTLVADASRLVYAVSNISSPLAAGALGNLSLTASSTTPGAAGARPGTSLPGLGDGGVDAVVGGSSARSAATGGYIISGVSLAIAKSVVAVRDPAGGTRVMPGSVLTYRVVLTVSGNGIAENLSMTDPLPAQTTYGPGSITVDGAARTDAADSDNASFVTLAGIGNVGVLLGNTAAPAVRVVEFKVTVN